MKKIKRFVYSVLILLIAGGLYLYYKNPEEFKYNVDKYAYKFFNRYIFEDINAKNNKEDVLKIAVNKEYSASTLYAYYNNLSSDEKLLYEKIYDAIKKYDTEVKLNIKIDSESVEKVYTSILYDHPEDFYLSDTYACSYDNDGYLVLFEIKYNDLINDIEVNKEKFNDAINIVIDNANKLSLDYEKEIYVHDYLSSLITYDSSVSDKTAYGAIINKKSLCTGYSFLYQIIMNKLGIRTYTVFGYAKENHTWNIVELEDGYYNVDLTWDDQEKRTIYKYFNVSDNMIKEDHERNNDSLNNIKCNGEKYLNSYSLLGK